MRRLGCLIGLSALFLVSASAPADAPAKSRLLEFSITEAPQPSDWRYFLKTTEKRRKQLWTYHREKGRGLGAWNWAWRLGWVKACTFSHARFCGRILREALFDDALVVRAEAATHVGRRYEDSANEQVVRVLAKAYGDKRNLRRGKPVMVQRRVLFALKQIGGDTAHQAASRLASSHDSTRRYWRKLEKVAQN